MPRIEITQDAFDWFQKARKIEREDVIKGKIVKRKFTIQENELIILMLNMWEAGNLAKQVSDCVKDPNKQFPQKIFEHYNGVFYRSMD